MLPTPYLYITLLPYILPLHPSGTSPLHGEEFWRNFSFAFYAPD